MNELEPNQSEMKLISIENYSEQMARVDNDGRTGKKNDAIDI